LLAELGSVDSKIGEWFDVLAGEELFGDAFDLLCERAVGIRVIDAQKKGLIALSHSKSKASPKSSSPARTSNHSPILESTLPNSASKPLTTTTV
jgi:hypothetical protein